MRIDRNVSALLLATLLVSLFTTSISLTDNHQETTVLGLNRSVTDDVLGEPESNLLVAGTPHSSITIHGNGEFEIMAEAESWDGEGIESSPYIIQGFDFDIGGSAGTCIEITDTTCHFIIKDCSMQGADPGYGIYFSNVTNCEISNNTLFMNNIGMSISANNISIVNNNIDATSWTFGMYIAHMENSRVSGNSINGG